MRYLPFLLLLATGWWSAHGATYSVQIPTPTTLTNNTIPYGVSGRQLSSTAITHSGRTNLHLPGYLTLSGQTNQVADNGTALTYNGTAIGGGGGGDTIWTNVSGTIQPLAGQTTNRLSFTSGAADNATNVALVVDTVNAWTDGRLLSVRNASVEQGFITPFGGILSGPHTTNWWGTDMSGVAFVSSAEVSQGDHWFKEIIARVATDDNHYGIFEADVETNRVWLNYTVVISNLYNGLQFEADPSNNILLTIRDNSVDRVALWPNVASSGSAIAHFLDTSNVLTNGDSLLLVANAGVTHGRIAGNSGYTGAGTKFLSDDGTYKAAGASDNWVAEGTTNSTLAGEARLYNLVATNNATVAGRLRIADGTAALPSLVFTSDDDASGTGFYRTGANAFGVSVNGALKALFASSTLDLISANTLSWNSDAMLARDAAAIVQQGIDTSTPISQTYKGPDGVGTDITAGSMTIAGGRRTGTGAGGSVRLQTTPSATSTGSSAGTLIDRQVVVAKGKVLTDASAVSLFEVALPTLKMAGGKVTATIVCTDGTDMQSFSQEVQFAAVNKGGTYTTSIVVMPTDLVSGLGAKAVSAGTLTTTWSILNGTDKVTIQLNADTSLTPSTNAFVVYYQVFNNSEQAITIL